jgi:hypothetical protein
MTPCPVCRLLSNTAGTMLADTDAALVDALRDAEAYRKAYLAALTMLRDEQQAHARTRRYQQVERDRARRQRAEVAA